MRAGGVSRDPGIARAFAKQRYPEPKPSGHPHSEGEKLRSCPGDAAGEKHDKPRADRTGSLDDPSTAGEEESIKSAKT